jgi:hypothetical protein
MLKNIFKYCFLFQEFIYLLFQIIVSSNQKSFRNEKDFSIIGAVPADSSVSPADQVGKH